MALKYFAKGAYDLRLHFLHGRCWGKQIGQTDDRVVGNPARDDSIEVGHIRVDVQCKPVAGGALRIRLEANGGGLGRLFSFFCAVILTVRASFPVLDVVARTGFRAAWLPGGSDT